VFSDAVEDWQCVQHCFLAREVDTCNSCHALNSLPTGSWRISPGAACA
jgi:hypothetical protein